MPLIQTEPKKLYIRVNEVVHVTGVSLNKSSISLTTPGQTEQLTATITPNNADDQAVTWSSSDTSVATVDQTGLVTCVTPGNCTITVTTHDGGYTATCSVATQTILFNFGDWTNSTWTVYPGRVQGTITKTSSYVSFYNSGNYSVNYLSQYPIDCTRDFLLEFNGNIPNTYAGGHDCGLSDLSSDIVDFNTNWESAYAGKIRCRINGSKNGGETNPGTTDYFIRKVGSTLEMGWGGATKYTTTHTFNANSYYLWEGVYNDTLTINTAKLTYL